MIEQNMTNLKPALNNKTRPPFGKVSNYDEASFALSEAITEVSINASKVDMTCEHCQNAFKALWHLRDFINNQPG